MLCRSPARVVGVDISAPCVAYAREAWCSGRPGTQLRFEVADVAQLDSTGLSRLLDSDATAASGGAQRGPDGAAGHSAACCSFDLVYANASLLHLPPRDLSRMLRALACRVDRLRGLLVANFITFALSSLQPRKGGGYARLRGLRVQRQGEAVEGMHQRAQSRDDEGLVRAACRAISELGLTLRYEDDQERQLAKAFCDEHSALDDGGGLGLEVHTGSEFVPGVFERHYSLPALRALVEAAGWRVRLCRLNHQDEGVSGAGAYIYLVAQPPARPTATAPPSDSAGTSPPVWAT